jgi:hypothetical protein
LASIVIKISIESHWLDHRLYNQHPVDPEPEVPLGGVLAFKLDRHVPQSGFEPYNSFFDVLPQLLSHRRTTRVLGAEIPESINIKRVVNLSESRRRRKDMSPGVEELFQVSYN